MTDKSLLLLFGQALKQLRESGNYPRDKQLVGLRIDVALHFLYQSLHIVVLEEFFTLFYQILHLFRQFHFILLLPGKAAAAAADVFLCDI